MYLSELSIWNYRKYGIKKDPNGNEEAGVKVQLNSKLNLLVGENDSGKTAIIDAVKMLLGTQSNDYLRLEIEDFYLEEGKDEKDRSDEFRIEGIFRGFSIEEAKNFIEWLSFETNDKGESCYCLRLLLKAKREVRGTYYDIKAGYSEEGGQQLDGRVKELLKATYLKPLRDAESELSSRKNSRLSQVLYNHETFADKEEHELIKIINEANASIKRFFYGVNKDDTPLVDQSGKVILGELNEYLNNFSQDKNLLEAYFNIADVKLKSILEKLSVNLSNNKSGLGSLNLLFIATELLLLKRKNFTGLRLALIEEIEAHLHPQAQIRLIKYLQDECNKSDIQLILSSHSNTISSVIDIENLIICKNGKSFNMSSKYTQLRKGDYLYLQRFLDATKANIFFSNGVIFVEGDAENLLIPTIAKIIDLTISKFGVSIVNVGSTAFLRYCNIFQRKDENQFMNMPVSCITDLDVKPFGDMSDYKVNKDIVSYKECCAFNKARKESLYTKQQVKCFVSNSWTLEYCIALGNFCEEFYRAVIYAEYIQNSEQYGLTIKKLLNGYRTARRQIEKFRDEQKSNEEIAYYIYNDYLLEKKISKAIVAQCFSQILIKMKREKCKTMILQDENIAYLVNAIKYACGFEV